jgi:hypothetical protein
MFRVYSRRHEQTTAMCVSRMDFLQKSLIFRFLFFRATMLAT